MSRPPTVRRPFDILDQPHGDHPVDLFVDRIPEIATRARRLLRLAALVQRRCNDNGLFLRYEDLRLHQRTEREEAYYNCGWEHGHLAGRAASRDARTSPAARTFSNALQVLLATSSPPDRMAMAVMLELARALVLGARLDTSRRTNRTARSRPRRLGRRP